LDREKRPEIKISIQKDQNDQKPDKIILAEGILRAASVFKKGPEVVGNLFDRIFQNVFLMISGEKVFIFQSLNLNIEINSDGLYQIRAQYCKKSFRNRSQKITESCE